MSKKVRFKESFSNNKPEPSILVQKILNTWEYAKHDLPPGKHTNTMRQAVNWHKFLIGPAYLLMLIYYGVDLETNPRAVQLMIMHGTYGWTWLYKDLHFPDKAWNKPVTFVSGISFFLGLNLLWANMFCHIHPDIDMCPGGMIFKEWYYQHIGLLSFVWGMWWHYGSDCQKYYSLKYRPNQLVCNGFWAYTRHPNYLGEFLIYTGYFLTSGHAVPFYLTLGLFVTLFLPNILQKDAFVSRYPNYNLWKKNTGLIIPSLRMFLYDFFNNLFCKNFDEDKMMSRNEYSK